MNFNLHFGESHSNNSINDKNDLFENYILKCYNVKRILISFNCFSEYISRGRRLEYQINMNLSPRMMCSKLHEHKRNMEMHFNGKKKRFIQKYHGRKYYEP